MSVPESVEPVRYYIRREQVLRLAQQLPVNLIANLCVVSAFVFIYYGKVPTLALIVWAVYSQLVNAYGLHLVRRCRAKIAEPGLVACFRHFSVYALADAITFAVAIWLFFVPGSLFYNLFLFVVLMGISAGGQTTLFSHLRSAILFSLLIVLAAIVRMLTTGESGYYLLAMMAAVFAAVLTRIAISFNRNLLDTWRLRYELETELHERRKMERGLRESEQRYRDIVELSPDAIVIQQDGRLVYANDAALGLLSVQDLDSLRTHGLNDFLSFDEQFGQASIETMLEQQMEFPHKEDRLKLAEDQYLDVELRGKAIYYNDKPALQMIIQDITERKQMDRMKDEFISIVSHELRTPITAILGAVGIIRGTQASTLDDKRKQLVDIIYNNSQTLVNLVNDILDVSKIEGGKLVFMFEECDLNELLDEVIKDNATYASQYDVQLKLERNLTVSSMRTDRLRLKQILANIISNAIKHSPESDSVVVHATNNDTDLMVSVQDHGSGIPKEFRGRIFSKFEQSQDNNRKVIKGTGLGLYLTKSLVEQFHGEIWYETAENTGTTFYIKLPMQ